MKRADKYKYRDNWPSFENNRLSRKTSNLVLSLTKDTVIVLEVFRQSKLLSAFRRYLYVTLRGKV
jgi:hypothetical protein